MKIMPCKITSLNYYKSITNSGFSNISQKRQCENTHTFHDLCDIKYKLQINKSKIVELKDKLGTTKKANIIHNKKCKSIYIKRGKDTLGGMTYSISHAPIEGENYPDFYKGKDYYFINSLYSHQKYKGIGTELVKFLVKESKKHGCEGRICLNASTTNPEKGSPIPFYYKLGFESCSKEKDKIIKKALQNSEKTPETFASTTLFLTEKGIKKLLLES